MKKYIAAVLHTKISPETFFSINGSFFINLKIKTMKTSIIIIVLIKFIICFLGYRLGKTIRKINNKKI